MTNDAETAGPLGSTLNDGRKSALRAPASRGLEVRVRPVRRRSWPDADKLRMVREVFAEDVIWDTTATTFPNAGLYEGHAGVERFFIDWLGTFRELEFENPEYIDAGDSVVVVLRWKGLGKTSGVETEATMFGVYDLRDGKIIRYRQYETRDQALAAAGAG